MLLPGLPVGNVWKRRPVVSGERPVIVVGNVQRVQQSASSKERQALHQCVVGEVEEAAHCAVHIVEINGDADAEQDIADVGMDEYASMRLICVLRSASGCREACWIAQRPAERAP
jgi:hypothetical protein